MIISRGLLRAQLAKGLSVGRAVGAVSRSRAVEWHMQEPHY